MEGDLGKLIVANGFENLPKVQWIAQSGHTGTQNKFWSKIKIGKVRTNQDQID